MSKKQDGRLLCLLVKVFASRSQEGVRYVCRGYSNGTAKCDCPGYQNAGEITSKGNVRSVCWHASAMLASLRKHGVL